MSGASSSASSPKPSGSVSVLAQVGLPEPVNRHAPTPLEQQRLQLAKLLKDPAKAAFVPKPPKEKGIRPPREMMKNVQGSSAGAGSGEFHVYKQNRRREYERVKLMDEKAQREAEEEEFEKRKREREEAAEAKTSKNRAKRQKKKERGKGKEKGDTDDAPSGETNGPSASGGVIKKRRLVDGTAMTFRRPDAGSDEDEAGDDDDIGPWRAQSTDGGVDGNAASAAVPVVEETKIIIHDDD